MDKTYSTKRGFRQACWALAVLCGVTVVFLPFSLMMLWLAYKASVRVTDDRIVISWFGTREHPWSDIASLERVRAAGLVGALMAPVSYSLRSKPGGNPRIAVGALENSEELLEVITRKTGLALAA